MQPFEFVKLRLRKKDTILINIPSGTTNRIHPLDMCINKSFKCCIIELFEKHPQENMNFYFESKLSISDRRVLNAKRDWNFWSKIKTSLKDTIVCSFLICGIFKKLDMSDDHLIDIRSLQIASNTANCQHQK